jgi:hypothetical protein
VAAGAADDGGEARVLAAGVAVLLLLLLGCVTASVRRPTRNLLSSLLEEMAVT